MQERRLRNEKGFFVFFKMSLSKRPFFQEAARSFLNIKDSFWQTLETFSYLLSAKNM